MNKSLRKYIQTKKIQIILVFLLLIAPCANAQHNLNFGLSQPQDNSTLPKSKTAIINPVRKEKINTTCILKPAKDNEFILSSGWEMLEAEKSASTGENISQANYNSKNWYNAVVPGTVLTTLVEQGVYPHPYFGLNNLVIPDTLCRMDWWYRVAFKLSKEQADKNVWLVLNGINYRAIVWLNGKKIGKINGAFVRGQFNVSEIINKSGDNVLAVHILPPPNPGIPHEESPSAGQGPNGGQLCLDGPTFISSEGWDWVPGIRDRNIGIWQDVSLRFTEGVILFDPQVITDLLLPDTSVANITIKTQVRNSSKIKQTVEVVGTIENITFNQSVDLEAGQTKTVSFSPEKYAQLAIKNPHLWWPNGYGKQNLYSLKLKVINEGAVSDEKVIRFGIRELSYEINVDAPKQNAMRIEFNPIKDIVDGKPVFNNNKTRVHKEGISIASLHSYIDASKLSVLTDTIMNPYLVIKVNGQRVFCKGGNWGMDDAMKQVDREHLEPYFRLHKDANFTMIRNWTGESTEEVFYELADEYGLMVWNDFWLSTEGYNLNPNDNLLFLENAKDVLRRYRNHPSIVVWCARNEGSPLPQLEAQLETLIAAEDPTRHYNPNSRALNLRWSGPWHYLKNQVEYFNNIAYGFSTELGTPSIPTAETMRKMMSAEDVWPISDVWYYHDLHNGQKDYIETIEKLYGKSESLEEFCKKAQMINYDSHRTMFESWNSRLWNNTSGILLWMTHPAWPSTVWQVYSSDYETFGSYFGSKKACEPIHIQLNLDNNKIVAINTTLKTLNSAKVTLQIFDINGKNIYTKDSKVDVLPNQLIECNSLVMPENLPEIYLVRLSVKDLKNTTLSINEYWKTKSDKYDFTVFNKLAKPTLVAKLISNNKGKNNQIVFDLKNNGKVPAIGIKLNITNSKSGEIVLPAYFSDEYFTLMPGESRIVKAEFKNDTSAIVTVSGYNLDRLAVIRF